MKQYISSNDFHDWFKKVRPDNFSFAGLDALFEYLEELEDSIGEEQDFDGISICCEYSEYRSAIEAAEQYGWCSTEYEYDDEDSEDLEQKALEWLQDRTTVIDFDHGVIIQQF